VFCWGDEFAPRGRMMANTWQGEFPWQNLLLDRYAGTSPVGAFPPSGYGLVDMAGSVWEWTSDHFTSPHPGPAGKPCCVPHNPQLTSPPAKSRSRARSSRAARTCVRRTTAAATGPPPAKVRRWTPPPVTSASAASSATHGDRPHPAG